MNPLDINAWVKNTQNVLEGFTKLAESNRDSLTDEQKKEFEKLKNESSKAFKDIKKASKSLSKIDITNL